MYETVVGRRSPIESVVGAEFVADGLCESEFDVDHALVADGLCPSGATRPRTCAVTPRK